MNLFKKKKKKIEEQLRSRTILSSLYGERWNLKYLENKIKNIKIDAYTKAEVDKMHQDMDDKLTNHIQRYVELHDRVNSNLSDIVVLRTEQRRIKDKADSNKSEISNLKTELGNTNTKVENNKAEIDKLKQTNTYADLEKENVFKKANVFNSTVKINGSTTAKFINIIDTNWQNKQSAVNMEFLNYTKTRRVQNPYKIEMNKKRLFQTGNFYWYKVKAGNKILILKDWLSPFMEYSTAVKDNVLIKIYFSSSYMNTEYLIMSKWLSVFYKDSNNDYTTTLNYDFTFVSEKDFNAGNDGDFTLDGYWIYEISYVERIK